MSGGGLLIREPGIGLAHLSLRGLFHLIPTLGLGQLKEVGLGLVALIKNIQKVVTKGQVDALRGKCVAVCAHFFLTAQKIGNSLLVIHGYSSFVTADGTAGCYSFKL